MVKFIYALFGLGGITLLAGALLSLFWTIPSSWATRREERRRQSGFEVITRDRD